MADDRSVAGGPAQPVHITNLDLPSSPPTGTQDVRLTSALPAGTNNIGDMDVLSVIGVTQLPTTLGQKTAANSLAVTLASDQAALPGSIADGSDAALGAKADTSATTDIGTFSLIALFKRYLERFTTFLALLPSALDSGTFKTSSYAKGTANGDTPLTLESAANPNLRVSLWSGSSGASISAGADGQAAATGVVSLARCQFWNGASWDRVRIATIFKTVAITSASGSGDIAVWTPTSGKKFRLLSYQIEITGDATLAVAGVNTLAFRDATTPINITHSVYIPSVALNAFASNTIQNPAGLGNGVLSSTINNVLNLNVGTALVAGTIRVNVCGTEE